MNSGSHHRQSQSLFLHWRERVYEILELARPGDRVAVLARNALVVLVLLSVLSVILETVPSVQETYGWLLDQFEIFAVIMFTLEYVMRFWAAPDYPPWKRLPAWKARLRYVLTPTALVDLATVMPFYLAYFISADFRVFIMFRLLRLLKLARYSPGMRSLSEAVYIERRALLACAVILLALVVGTAAVMHMAEHKAQPDRFGTIPDAMWWSVVTLTTVGYGDSVPITPLGKVIASLTALMGLVMLALPVGIIATSFAQVIHRRDFVVTWGMVVRVPLFASLSPDDISNVMRFLRSQVVQPDEIIVRRGDKDRRIYFITSGQVSLDHGHRHDLISDGEFFGSITLDEQDVPHTSTARARVRSDLLVLEVDDVRHLFVAHPEISEHVRKVHEKRMTGPPDEIVV
ncbi:MAG: cyclic nucleotide-binding domain-containing protein [Beijerinckiaceae bacterium]|nr:cyclic nucleotide-binding domain-containing protein [Beijerinckiaceae bacterium]